MIPNLKYLNLSKKFWANVRTIGQYIGYTERKTNRIKIPSIEEIINTYRHLNFDYSHIINNRNEITNLGMTLFNYFNYRAEVLNGYVESRLMDVQRAEKVFNKIYNQFKPKCPIPMNKQKGEKKSPAYLTGIVNMIIEKYSQGFPCDFDPNKLTTITRNRQPLRTLARRIDGAFPDSINPISVWEIKEYYYTTTFGSRVADGVYESLLDGMELEELKENENIDVKHYLFVDSHYTWWECGRSYLCRIIDMLHMQYLDEALFGYEVIERLPSIVKEWISIIGNRNK